MDHQPQYWMPTHRGDQGGDQQQDSGNYQKRGYDTHPGGGHKDGGEYQKRSYDGDNANQPGFNREWTGRQDYRGGRGGGRGRGRFEGNDSGGRGGGRFEGRGGRGGRYEQRDGGRGRGRGGYGRKDSRSSYHSGPDYAQGDQSQQQKYTPEEMAEKFNKPVPPEERRTLVLSNVPPHVNSYIVRDFFQRKWDARTQYYMLDKSTGEALVRFLQVEDAQRVWEGASSQGLGDLEDVGMESLGITAKAVHFTNYIVDRRPPREERPPTDHGHGHSGHRARAEEERVPPSAEEVAEKYNKPVPPEERKTLILSHVPAHLNSYIAREFFQRHWSAQVQYYQLDRSTGEAFVRFRNVEDAQRVWEGGTEGLDGARHAGHGHGEEDLSLVSLGVQLKAMHFTNYIVDNRPPREDQGDRGFDRKRNWREDQPDRGYGSGGRSHHSHQPSKMARHTDEERHSQQPYFPPPPSHHGNYTDQYGDPSQQNHRTPQTAGSSNQSTPSTHPKNNTYVRSPSKQPRTQMSVEEKERWEKFQKDESEWRERRQAEYSAHTEAKNSRMARISLLEQKRDGLSKQEEMLNKTLPVHKKLLAALKKKDAPASEQSKKMKEILNAQTKVMELKKEMKGLVEEIEKLREEEEEKGAFKPSEKRPIFSGAAGGSASGGGQKRSLDRRTTVLMVEGFGYGTTEDAVKDHFSTFGSVTSISLDNNTPPSSFALVTFANRADAERAKVSGARLNDVDLTCTWHNSSPSTTTPINDAETLESGEEASTGDAHSVGVNANEGLYDDVDADFGGDVFEEAAPADNEEAVDYDYDDEGDLVDYD